MKTFLVETFAQTFLVEASNLIEAFDLIPNSRKAFELTKKELEMEGKWLKQQ